MLNKEGERKENTPCISSKEKYLSIEFSTVTEFFRRKAELELHETEESRQTCLQELKSMILSEKHVWKPNMEDEFLLRFLRHTKFDCHRALKLLKSYYTYQKQYPKLFDDYVPSCVTHVMRENFINFLPYRTASGCIIWYSRSGLWNPKSITFTDLLKLGLMCLEKAAENPVTQICGVISIVDCKGFNWEHLIHLSPSNLRCFVNGVQDCFPLRQKAIHVVNEHAIFRLVFALIRPLLSSKMKDRIFFHGSDMNSLHAFVPADILPEELSGSLGPFQNERFYESLMQDEETFIKNKKFGCCA